MNQEEAYNAILERIEEGAATLDGPARDGYIVGYLQAELKRALEVLSETNSPEANRHLEIITKR